MSKWQESQNMQRALAANDQLAKDDARIAELEAEVGRLQEAYDESRRAGRKLAEHCTRWRMLADRLAEALSHHDYELSSACLWNEETGSTCAVPVPARDDDDYEPPEGGCSYCLTRAALADYDAMTAKPEGEVQDG